MQIAELSCSDLSRIARFTFGISSIELQKNTRLDSKSLFHAWRSASQEWPTFRSHLDFIPIPPCRVVIHACVCACVFVCVLVVVLVVIAGVGWFRVFAISAHVAATANRIISITRREGKRSKTKHASMSQIKTDRTWGFLVITSINRYHHHQHLQY